jgi:hypothetical protein
MNAEENVHFHVISCPPEITRQSLLTYPGMRWKWFVVSESRGEVSSIIVTHDFVKEARAALEDIHGTTPEFVWTESTTRGGSH